MQIKRILVPTDFSEYSKRALGHALALARVHGATVIIVHVFPPPAYAAETAIASAVYDEIETQQRAEAERQIREVRDELAADDVPTEIRVLEGTPFVEIIRAAQTEDADLIVIATHGATGLERVLLGSVAEKVVRKARCPVLTVKEKDREATAS